MKTHLLNLTILTSICTIRMSAAQPPGDIPDIEHSAVSSVPLKDWTSGFLTGNGNMGVIMCGNPWDESLVVTGKLYLPMGSKEILPDLSGFRDEFKQAGLAAGKDGPARVHQLMLEKCGHVLVNTDPLHPACFLQLKMKEKSESFSNYRMTENFATGELQVRWSNAQGEWSRKLFVSRTDDVAVLSLTGPKGKVDCEVAMQVSHPLVKSELSAEAGWLTAHNTYLKGKGGYDNLIRVIPSGGEMSVNNDKLSIRGADSLVMILQVKRWKEPLPRTQSEAWTSSPENPIYRDPRQANPLPEMKKFLSGLSADYAVLLAPHAKAHGILYGRVAIDLGGGQDRQITSEELLARAAKENKMPKALAERLYNGCRYLIICSTGDTPPNLQGIWSGTWSPAWSGDYTTDSNLQLEVQSMMSCNMPELMHSYFNLVDSWMPDWRLNAKKIYGFRGAVSNTRASDNCLLVHWGGEWPGDQCAIGLAGWMLHFYYDYYQFTGDRKFLADRFVPMAKEIAVFYEDFLSGTEDAGGKFRFYMGYSPEHGMSANTTFDIAIAKNVFATLIAACKVLGSDQDKLPQWQAMLDKMPPYLCNERGELQEWSWPGVGEDYNQRHHSHFLPLYQFCEFSRERTPELWKASGLAFEQKTKHWLWNAADSNSNHITHGMMNQGQCAARLGRSDVVYDVLERMTTRRYVYPSFMISYWPGLNGFGFDPVGTIPDVLNNALIFAWNDTVDLLPAIPREWPQGSIKGVLVRGRIQVEELTWDIPAGKVGLSLTSGQKQTVTCQLPPGVRIRSARVDGQDAGNVVDSARPCGIKLALPENKIVRIELTFAPGDFAAVWDAVAVVSARSR